MTGLEIRPLSAENVDDLLAFFGTQAFAGNPYWQECYCYFYHSPEEEWDAGAQKAAEHREAKRRHVLAGRSHGYLAYRDGKIVGWLNAALRESYENPRGFAAARDGTAGVGALMCFNVAPRHRGRGVASAMLRAACDGFRRQGLRHAEGYPRLGDLGDYAIMRKTL